MNDIIRAFRNGFANYANFSGRASRPEFWWWALSILILIIIVRIVDAYVVAPLLGFSATDDLAGRPLSFILGLVLILPNLAMGVRRLHDTGRSGWWILIGLIPLIGSLILIYFYVQPSDEGDNDHGAKPGWPPVSA